MLRNFNIHVDQLKSLQLQEKIIKAGHKACVLLFVELSDMLDPEDRLRTNAWK